MRATRKANWQASGDIIIIIIFTITIIIIILIIIIIIVVIIIMISIINIIASMAQNADIGIMLPTPPMAKTNARDQPLFPLTPTLVLTPSEVHK